MGLTDKPGSLYRFKVMRIHAENRCNAADFSVIQLSTGFLLTNAVLYLYWSSQGLYGVLELVLAADMWDQLSVVRNSATLIQCD